MAATPAISLGRPAPAPVVAIPAMGVEEEFVLLDPVTGRVRLTAPRVLAALRGVPGVKPEIMRYQVEVATRPAVTSTQIYGELAARRSDLAAAAVATGSRLVASGTAPYDNAIVPLPLMPILRYRDLARRFPWAAPAGGTCGCHVHVGIADREQAAQVLVRLRPWLPVILALGANSPFYAGRETGWDSTRFRLQSRWPSALPPPVVHGAAEYDAGVRRLVAARAALDLRSVYYFARLSPQYSTVEVRVSDVCLSVRRTVLVAVLVRALVMALLDEVRQDLPMPDVPHRRLVRALRAAARVGPDGVGIDAFTGRAMPLAQSVEDLVALVRPALATTGDLGFVTDAVSDGVGRSGAARQRSLFRAARTPEAFVEALAEASLAGC